jgi:hypothetical protein
MNVTLRESIEAPCRPRLTVSPGDPLEQLARHSASGSPPGQGRR